MHRYSVSNCHVTLTVPLQATLMLTLSLFGLPGSALLFLAPDQCRFPVTSVWGRNWNDVMG